MLKEALAEEARLCRALALGRHSVLLYKGSPQEIGWILRPKQFRFWLVPVQASARGDLNPDTREWFEEMGEAPADGGCTSVSAFARLLGIYQVHELVPLLLLGYRHGWSEDAVRSWFAQNPPGLSVLAVRVYRIPHAFDVMETAIRPGWHEWFQLDREHSTEGAVPVLPDTQIEELLHALDIVLNPTAFA